MFGGKENRRNSVGESGGGKEEGAVALAADKVYPKVYPGGGFLGHFESLPGNERSCP